MTKTQDMIEALAHCRSSLTQHLHQGEELAKESIDDLIKLADMLSESSDDANKRNRWLEFSIALDDARTAAGLK